MASARAHFHFLFDVIEHPLMDPVKQYVERRRRLTATFTGAMIATQDPPMRHLILPVLLGLSRFN